MSSMILRKGLALAALAAVALQPISAQAQQACVTEDEVSAMAIYSVPNLVEGVRVRCAGQLSASGFINRPNNPVRARYAQLQNRVWPRAKSGLLKVLTAKAGRSATASPQNMAMLTSLPDNAVRPLVDALIAQEVGPRIALDQCGRVERVVELAAPIDPETAGNVLGAVIGLVNPKDIAVCQRRS